MKEQRNIYHGCVIVSTPTGLGFVYADSEGVRITEDGYEHVVYECTYRDASGNLIYTRGGSADDCNAARRSIGKEIGRAKVLAQAIQIARASGGKAKRGKAKDEAAD